MGEKNCKCSEVSRKLLAKITDIPQRKCKQKEPSATQVSWSWTAGVLLGCNQPAHHKWGPFSSLSLLCCKWPQGMVLKVCITLAVIKASLKTPRNRSEAVVRVSFSYKINQIFAYKSLSAICSSKKKPKWEFIFFLNHRTQLRGSESCSILLQLL